MGSETENWLQWLENSALAEAISKSFWLYPALEIVHIIGIAMLVGAAFMFDLRLLGFSKKLTIEGLGKHLLPWSLRGLWLIVPSGLLLFITNAETLAHDRVFWAKMSLLLLGGINAFVFHSFILKANPSWDRETSAPPKAKMSACISILVWIAVITCGRLLAY